MGDAGHIEGSGAGNWALKGYDYQADVSVWLALDLMVASRLTAQIMLEHVSEEDVEADIEENEPHDVSTGIPMHGYRLIVQAKRRTGNAWTLATFASLLEHGKRRKSAKARLEEDPHARYLLVTSASLQGDLLDLHARSAAAWPAPSKMPDRIKEVGQNLPGRVAIVSVQDDERLVTDIEKLLAERFRVPRNSWSVCLDELRDAASKRMRGAQGGVWRREEVELTLKKHGAYLVSDPALEAYVEPTNWGDIIQAMKTSHAAIIIGQSGSGKTITTDAIFRELKKDIPDLERIHVTHGPDQLRADDTVPPVLYDIEDPWGRFRFEPNSRPWNDKLAPAFQSARHDRLFIATSRLDIANSSGALANIKRWQISLDAENYGLAERTKLYRNLLANLPTDVAAFAHTHESNVLERLSLPLEISKFFDALPQLDVEQRTKHPTVALNGAIEQAHEDTIERTVIDQIEARDAAKSAAILWALIKPNGRLSADVLRNIADRLVDADSSLEEQLEPLVDSFVIARNFRQGSDGSLGYYHNKVEAGIEKVLTAHPHTMRRSLKILVDVLVELDGEDGGHWGTETAAKIVQLSVRIPHGKPTLTRTSQDKIDQWIASKASAQGRELETLISMAAIVGSARSSVSELARWFAHRPDPSFPGFTEWGCPIQSDEWYERMHADADVAQIASTYVQTVIPDSSTGYPRSFYDYVSRLAPDLSSAFISAAKKSVNYGYIRNDDVIAYGAATDIEAFDTIIDEAIDAITPTEEDVIAARRDRLLVVNDEVSEDYGQHIAERDDGATAQTYIKEFVRRLRVERGWEAISGHRHINEFRRYWLSVRRQHPWHRFEVVI